MRNVGVEFDPARRHFMQMAGFSLGVSLLEPGVKAVEPFAQFFSPERPNQVSVNEVLNRFPEINPALGLVNTSRVPNTLRGKYQGFHECNGRLNNEQILLPVPISEILKGKITFYGEDNGLARGVCDAIKRGQKTFLVLEIPDFGKNEEIFLWLKNLPSVIRQFNGNTVTFIIGNECNWDQSTWFNHEGEYSRLLYLPAYEQIKKINPKIRVAPWQEAYNLNGEMLERFLRLVPPGKVDKLPINCYITPEEISRRVSRYCEILHQSGFPNTPIYISELGQPLADYLPTLNDEQLAALVVQLLSTCAHLIQEGKIESAAWFCGYTDDPKLQEHCLITSKNDVKEVRPAFFAYVLCQHLLTGRISMQEDSNHIVRATSVNEKTKVMVVWNNGNTPVPFSAPKAEIWTPTGVRYQLSRPTTLTLQPSSDPRLCSGEALILIF